MESLRFLAVTSMVLGAILGAMSRFIFHLPALASGGIAVTSTVGLFMIVLVMSSITFKRSMRYSDDQ